MPRTSSTTATKRSVPVHTTTPAQVRHGGVPVSRLAADMLNTMLAAVGLIYVLIPLFMYWLVHGDKERYLWLLNGPAPLNSLGTTTYQAGILLTCLVLGALSLAVAGWGRVLLSTGTGHFRRYKYSLVGLLVLNAAIIVSVLITTTTAASVFEF